MPLDTYSKMLLVIDICALLFLRQYLDNSFMLVPFGLLLVMVWIWLYRLLAPLKFNWSALAALVSGLGLYVPDAYVRILCTAIVVPACAAAITKLVTEPEVRTGPGPG